MQHNFMTENGPMQWKLTKNEYLNYTIILTQNSTSTYLCLNTKWPNFIPNARLWQWGKHRCILFNWECDGDNNIIKRCLVYYKV